MVAQYFHDPHGAPPRRLVFGLGGKRLLRLSAAGAVVLVAALTQASEGRFVYDASGRRDPFIPLVTKDGAPLDPKALLTPMAGLVRLEGILWDPHVPLAMVNGEVKRIGEVVEGYRIVEINRESIIVELNGERETISLFPEALGGGARETVP